MFSKNINYNLRAIYKRCAMSVILIIFLMSSIAYADDMKIFPEANINTSKISWTIKYNEKYDKDTINGSTLYLLREKTGTKVICTYSFPNETTVVMTSTVRPIYNEKYSVVVTGGVKSGVTNEYIKTPGKKTFLVSEDLKIDSVLPIADTINVMQNEIPLLPQMVDVIYKDGSIGKEPIVWSAVSTSTIGEKKVSGKILGLSLYTTVTVNVIAVEYINNILLEYYPSLGIYLVQVEADSKVTGVSLNGLDMYYNENNNFQSYSLLTKGTTVTFNSYDATGKLLGQKKYLVEK